MQDRLEFGKDLSADLAEFAKRLNGLDIGQKIALEQEALAPRGKRRRQPIGRKIKQFFSSLVHINRTRRKLEALEQDMATLRKAFVAVVEREMAGIAQASIDMAGRFHEEANKARDATLQALARDGAAAADTTAQLRDAMKGDRDALEATIRKVEQGVQFERRTRQKAFTEFDRRLMLALRGGLPATGAAADFPIDLAATPSVQSLLESFYYLLEERYRGTREEIRQRLAVYSNDFAAARQRTGASGPVIDVGCGRGELLELLQAEGFQALGIDSNDTQLDAARAHGVPVLHADAIAYLQEQPAGSVLAVTGIHIVEHFPFADLVRLMQEVARVLKPGGVAIFETPNPRNLIVGATTFHLDPTHVRPLPPEVMQILLETVGFGHVEARLLHPSDTFNYMVEQRGFDRDIAALLFGPQDYAVIGVMR